MTTYSTWWTATIIDDKGNVRTEPVRFNEPVHPAVARDEFSAFLPAWERVVAFEHGVAH